MKDQALQIKKCEIIEVSFDLISYDAVMETIQRWRTDGKSHYVTLTNPHCVTLCHRDTKMRKAFEMADMTLPDGTGIILATTLLGYPHNGRITRFCLKTRPKVESMRLETQVWISPLLLWRI